MRDRRHLLLIPVGALLAVLPLIVQGSSCGHDFGFHLPNWLEVGSQWKQGILFPHWDFTADWNAGEPRFVFYPPLSWTIGAIAGLILPWVAVPNTFIWLALTACGFTMYRLAREWTSEGNALIAACFYMVHPYMLFTFYERSAFAELLAAAWIPLLVFALLRSRITMAAIALPVALLWLTDAPAAVMGCYLLALLGVVRVAWIGAVSKALREATKDAARITFGTCIGLALAGFYLVPAIVEQRWVQIFMVAFKGVRFQDNFLFGQFGDPSHKAILRTASLCSVALLVLIAAFAAIAFYRDTKKAPAPALNDCRFVIVALLLAALVNGFLLASPSAFLWYHIPELKNLQFPWRFSAILGALAAALLALALNGTRKRPAVAITIALAIPLVFSLEGNHLFRQVCYGRLSVSDQVEDFRSGNLHDSTDEYTPVGADWQAVGHDNPRAWIAAAPADPPSPNVPGTYSTRVADSLHFQASSVVPAFFVINLRDYAAWKVTVNGISPSSRPHRSDGLIVVPIPEGRSTINIRYVVTPDHIAGWILTALALMLLVVVWRKERARSAAFPVSATAAFASRPSPA